MNLLILIILNVGNAIALPTPKCTNQETAPAFVMTSFNSYQIFACGGPETAIEGKTHLNGMALYSLSPSGKREKLFQDSELENRLISASEKRAIVEELAWIAQNNVPVFEATYTCHRDRCFAMKERCHYKKVKPLETEILKIYEEYVSGAKKAEYPDEALVQRLADLALSGNKEAEKLLLEGKVRLDGASAEVYQDVTRLIKRMKKSKCL